MSCGEPCAGDDLAWAAFFDIRGELSDGTDLASSAIVMVQIWHDRVVMSHVHGELWGFRELSMILLGCLCARLVVSSAMA